MLKKVGNMVFAKDLNDEGEGGGGHGTSPESGKYDANSIPLILVYKV
jgi:hypothetical protein